MAENRVQATVAPWDVEHRTSWLLFISKPIVLLITAPYRRTFKLYTWKPLRAIRAAEGDREVMIELVRDFKMDKYAELQSVQVAASFCAGTTLATLPWSKGQNASWVADALWFSSLTCSIWAVITSIQTKSILDDLPSKEYLTPTLPESEVLRTRRTILRYRKTPGINHWIMIFIWQFPSMTMSYAWATFLAGLTVYMCNPFIRHEPWGNKHQIAIIYLIIAGAGLLTYCLATVFVYIGEKDFERSGVCPPATANEMEAGTARNKSQHDPNSVNTESARSARAWGNRRETDRSGRSKRQLLI